ncbi:hypothetical protein [Myroides sp. LJL119]
MKNIYKAQGQTIGLPKKETIQSLIMYSKKLSMFYLNDSEIQYSKPGHKN